MLMLTYALVALSVEQKGVSVRLRELQEGVHRLKTGMPVPDQSKIDALLKHLARVDSAWKAGNFELYVLPAIRLATDEAAELLAEIDELSGSSSAILKAVCGRCWQVCGFKQHELEELCVSLDLYCQYLLKRLAIEEMQLLPLAQRVISSDEWFDIAAQFISHGSERHQAKAFDREINPLLTSSQIASFNQSNYTYPAYS